MGRGFLILTALMLSACFNPMDAADMRDAIDECHKYGLGAYEVRDMKTVVAISCTTEGIAVIQSGTG